jgi:CubicO group peptidase (beta-lactamase class C family)
MDTPTVSLSIGSQQIRFTAVNSLLKQAVAEHVFPGCAFGVLVGGQVVCLDAVGRQTYAEDSPAILPATMYDLASVTKVMASTAMAMLLFERGAFELDQPLVGILPRFENPDVTLRHLLAHSSGLPGYARLFETEHTSEALIDACLKMPLLHPPGTHAEYSDIGFILLGKALEKLAGKPLDDIFRTEIAASCGLTNTGFRPASALRLEIPPTEDDTTFRHRVLQGEVQDENCFVLGGVSGHAGLFGDALDALRFAAAILQCTFVRKQTVHLFATRQAPAGSSRALGWDTPSANESSAGNFFGANSIGHLGYAGTSLWMDLEAEVAVVLLSNRTWPDRKSQAIRALRPRFHDAVGIALRN